MNPAVWKILEEHAAAVHSLLLRLTLRRDVAEELLQELFVKMATRMNVQNPGAYLRRAAINLAMDWRRRHRRERHTTTTATLVSDPPANAPQVGRMLEDAEDVGRILDAAEELPELARQAFVLRFVQNEPYERVGATVGRSAHQARGLCHWAVSEIRRKLGVEEAVHERAE